MYHNVQVRAGDDESTVALKPLALKHQVLNSNQTNSKFN